MNRFLICLVICFGVAISSGAAPAAPAPTGKWETVETSAASPSSEDRIDVVVRDGYIYVTSARPVQIRIITILGQPVSQSSLPAGTSRFKTGARGIYILKAGSQTVRITI